LVASRAGSGFFFGAGIDEPATWPRHTVRQTQNHHLPQRQAGKRLSGRPSKEIRQMQVIKTLQT
jgi:hypothetical protein